jgi:hypothetical protein
MPDTLDEYLASHETLLPELECRNGVRLFPLRLPILPLGRELGQVLLELPKDFPDKALAKIRLPADKILNIPHIESDGKLCLGNGDLGAASGLSPTERIQLLVESFFDLFLQPWCAGELDGDFVKEAQNYWSIYCQRFSTSQNAVTKLYVLDERCDEAKCYQAQYLVASRIVIAGSNIPLVERFIAAMGDGQQIRQVFVAEIPISVPFTPHSWPKNEASIRRLLDIRLGKDAAKHFFTKKGHRNRDAHRIVLLRAPNCSFGFLLSGGPPTIRHQGLSTRGYFTKELTPLLVERLDANWTYGRDQHHEVISRQEKHVLVVGAGALGSHVIEQLAKSGVGHITVVDRDNLSSSNIGRHVLGANAIGRNKAKILVKQFTLHWPSCEFKAIPNFIQEWLAKNDLSVVNMVLDLTGEPEVRRSIDFARKSHSCHLLIGWMEPYVAAAHACLLPKDYPWMNTSVDKLESLQAVTWPDDVMQYEPACSSLFQSYTPAAATHAVALVTEAALDLLDGKVEYPVVRHWIRGQKFLDKYRLGLSLRNWAVAAAPFDGVSLETRYE